MSNKMLGKYTTGRILARLPGRADLPVRLILQNERCDVFASETMASIRLPSLKSRKMAGLPSPFWGSIRIPIRSGESWKALKRRT